LERTIEKMDEYGLVGYWFRQFNISKYEPMMRFLVDAAWETSPSASASCRRHFRRVCGSSSVELLMEAISILGDALPEVDEIIGLGFEMPNLLRKIWEPNDYYRPPTVPELDALRGRFQGALIPLQHAQDLVESQGRPYV